MAGHFAIAALYSFLLNVARTLNIPIPLPRTPSWVILLCFVAISQASLAENTDLGNMTLLAVAPLDAQAVVKLPSGRLLHVRQGDKLPEVQATVLTVLNDKIVLEVPSPLDDPALRRQAWLYKTNPSDGSSRIQYLDRTPPPPPLILKPVRYPAKILPSQDASTND